jgi:hypothetical protein
MTAAAAESFQRQATVIAHDVRFVNSICDAGTALHMKVGYSGLANPTTIPDISPRNPQANNDWNAEQYESFYRESIINLLNDFPTLKVSGAVCDNLPGQVAGLRQLLESDPQRSVILQISRLNHMVNFVFIYALKFPPVADVLSILPGIIHMPNSSDAFEITCRHCPTILRTQWTDLVGVLSFILKHLNSVQTVFHLVDEPLISMTCICLYILFLLFALFSRAMETRSRLLAEVIFAACEVLRE